MNINFLKPFHLAAALVVALPLPALADTVTVPAAKIGWYAFDGQHEAGNPNTLTGRLTNAEYRSFFVWSVPKLSGTVTAAHVDFKIGYSLGASGPTSQIGKLLDLNTDKKNLSFLVREDGAGHGKKVFADLGKGAVYGKVTVPPMPLDDMWIHAKLNADGIAALNASQGKSFGFGIRNVTPNLRDLDYFLMSSGSFPSEQNLVIEFAPD